ncbi:hypothetical protein EQ500_04190 [Lactobacillus sp. XV13L]|nr:hypothetical protein [Lactobacillus sp. XV13L]
MLKEKQKNVNYFELLSESLQAFHNYTLFFARDNYFEVLFSSNKKKTAILAQKVRKAINEHKQLVFFDDASWHLTIKQTDHFSLATLDRLEKNSHYQDKPQRDLNYISSIYSICYDQHFFKLLDYYAGLPTPVCIAGADGLRKTYLSRLIAKKAGKNHLPLIEISLSNHEELEQAITDNSSPFFENNNLVQISGIEKMRQGDLHDFFTFIRKSNLASRNKLVFLISQAYGTKLTVDFPNDLNVNQLFLKPLNEMSYEVFNQLVRSILNDFSLKTGKTFSGVSDTALDLLSSYAWPHNYREFIQVLTTALATATGPILKGKDIEEILDQFSIAEKSRPEQTVDSTHNLETKGQTLHDAIVQIIKDKLKENHGNKTKTALELNISRATLWRYLK